MNEQLTKTDVYEAEIETVIDEIKDLFLAKNRSYNNDNDPMLNFTIGGILRHGNAGEAGRYEAMKDYVMKHIAKVYSHDISAQHIDESLRDIAVYMIIGIVMKRRFEKAIAQQYAQTTPKDLED